MPYLQIHASKTDIHLYSRQYIAYHQVDQEHLHSQQEQQSVSKNIYKTIFSSLPGFRN
jgi:hypothetical protein